MTMTGNEDDNQVYCVRSVIYRCPHCKRSMNFNWFAARRFANGTMARYTLIPIRLFDARRSTIYCANDNYLLFVNKANAFINCRMEMNKCQNCRLWLAARWTLEENENIAPVMPTRTQGALIRFWKWINNIVLAARIRALSDRVLVLILINFK